MFDHNTTQHNIKFMTHLLSPPLESTLGSLWEHLGAALQLTRL